MPTKKNKVQAILEDDIYYKLKNLADKDKRSISNFAGLILTEYIENYEKQNGSINIGSIQQDGVGNTINIG